MIDWQRICLNLRTHYKPLSKVAKDVGCDEATLQRLARGATEEPKFSTGLKLLDLHFDKCRQEHDITKIGKPHQQRLTLGKVG